MDFEIRIWMDKEKYYMNLPKDLSVSIAENRFKSEHPNTDDFKISFISHWVIDTVLKRRECYEKVMKNSFIYRFLFLESVYRLVSL